jgi:hypothetical protein
MKILKVYLYKSPLENKKFMAEIQQQNGTYKIIHFGAKGYSDYTIHKDPERKQRYINRHKSRENWTKSGINTPGFWSRWLLWGEPTLSASKKFIQDKFNIKIYSKIK